MYERILRSVLETPWAIMPSKLDQIMAFIELKAAGHNIDFNAAAPRPRATTQGKVAVIPVFGVLTQRGNMMSDISGATSYESIKAQIQGALDDSSVKSIVLDIDSPGGTTYGVQELSDFIYAARDKKHITAVANSLAASAAYWIGSSASEFIASPGADVGSIGVYTAHTDMSKADEIAGSKTTLIYAGRRKIEGNKFGPLTDEEKANIQARVDESYGMFAKSVARGRGVSAADVRNGFGEGSIVGAVNAANMNMIDRVATMDAVLERLGVNPANLRNARVKLI